MAASAAAHIAAFAALAAHRPALDVAAEQPVVNIVLVRAASPQADKRAPPPKPPPLVANEARGRAAPKPGPRRAESEPSAPATAAAAIAAASAPVIPAPGPAPAQPELAAAAPLDAYRRQVWARLAAHPPRAQPGAGVARVAFQLDASGGLVSLRLARSSGRPAFDRACLAAVRAAAPFPVAPPGLAPADLAFEVPIRAPEVSQAATALRIG